MASSQWHISKAHAYGGVLITRCGQVLLREPSNHFDGYVWTFAKGKPQPEDTPEETALREVKEETGYEAEVVDVLPGVFNSGLSGSAYFVMRHLGLPGPHDRETQAVRWVSFDEAERLIAKTTNPKGRERDLAVLIAAKTWFQANDTVVLPDKERDTGLPVQKGDWRTSDMPTQFVTLPLSFHFDAGQAKNIKQGFLPSMMEQKWFCYFTDNTLYNHRSWTGYCIDQIHFMPDGDGLRTTHAEVNRDPDQYTETRDDNDRQRIEGLLTSLSKGEMATSNGLMDALALAAEPLYLGNPQVVAELLEPYFQMIVANWLDQATYEDKLQSNLHITKVMSEDGHGYSRMLGWHHEDSLGRSVIRHFNLDEDYFKGDSLSCLVSEGLAAVDLAFGTWRESWIEQLSSGSDLMVQQKLQEISHFVITVFLGTNAVVHPSKTLKDFTFRDLQRCVNLAPVSAFQSPPKLSSFEQLLAELNAMDESAKKPAFKFEKLGIPIGAVLEFKFDPAVTCTVTDGNKVIYQGQVISLSKAAALALQRMGRKASTARGPIFWRWDSQLVSNIPTQGS